ncbi:Uncharacterized protein APZ42_026618 [Daphnia magna]|uniref:Uncharacterized protein n=1 Tax=Daphnia magna TaxID=35525 RepID=A0A164S406_9CRUS|nr:Uncharacterized protein APZ42_026618 [Daphnia magna]
MSKSEAFRYDTFANVPESLRTDVLWHYVVTICCCQNVAVSSSFPLDERN